MGSDISKAANLDDLTDPKGGIDLGLEDAGLGGGIGAIEAGAGAGAAVGILDGTAGEAYDWIRGRSDEVDLGPYDPSSFDPSTYRGGGGYAPDLDYSDVFSEAATDAEDETEEEDEDEPEDEPEEEDEDEEPQPRPDPRPIPSAGDPEEKKEIPDKPETKHVTFKAKPIGASLLRAMKRLPSQDLNVDDIETKEESKADKETINIIQDDMVPDTKTNQYNSLTDRDIRFKKPLYLPRDVTNDQIKKLSIVQPPTWFSVDIIPNSFIYKPLNLPEKSYEKHEIHNTSNVYGNMTFRREIVI